jgi:hypothetical protein
MDPSNKKHFLLAYETAVALGDELARIVEDVFSEGEASESCDPAERFVNALFDFYYMMEPEQYIRFLSLIYEMFGYSLPKAFEQYREDSGWGETPMLEAFLDAFVFSFLLKMEGDD